MPAPGHDQAVVIFRLGSMGDIIVSLPCFHAVARRFPSAKRLVLTNAPVSGLAAPIDLILGASGLIDETVFYSVEERGLRAARRLSRRLRALGTPTLIYLTERTSLFQVYRDLAFFRLSGFERIIGAPLTRDGVHPHLDPTTGEREFEAERLSRCMAALGPIDLDDRASWDLNLTNEEIAAAATCLEPLEGRPFVAINPGGKEQKKDWGDRNWLALLSALSARYRELALVIVGALPERQRFDQLGAGWGGAMINAAGKLMPRECAALLGRATVFLGHDSGPMHLAACVGTPCLALFGAGNSPAHTWYPYGPGHRVMHERRGIALIAPEAVLQEIERMLGDKVSSRPVSNPARPA